MRGGAFMPVSFRIFRQGALLKILGAGMAGSLAAGCAADSQRLAGNPFANPFDSIQTGSLPSAPEPQPQGIATAPVARAPLSGASTYAAPPAYPSGAQAARPDPVVGNAANWTATGGTAITVQAGDTVQSLASRYNVPATAIASANGVAAGARLEPGARVVIPVYAVGAGAASRTAGAAAAAVTHPVSEAGGKVKYQLVQGSQAAGTKVASLGKPTEALAGTKAAVTAAQVKPQDAKAAAKAAEKAAKTVDGKKLDPKAAAEAKAVEAKPAEAKVAARSAEAVQTAKAAEPAADKSDGDSAAPFRWPARGRVITGFNGKGGNEGINIAVPEGTPVKAAEGGVVAYAGSELKGYGNLILIRHDNGWVSAYANNSELLVKRGERVKRGQPVAKSGQTGNVASPQLHFELRKGATPVDPMPHLAGG